MTDPILGIAALVCATGWLLWRMLNYREPSDNRSEHFPDGEWRG